VIERLTGLLGTGGRILVECRNCGRTCEEDPEVCPACGGSEFAQYELE
jgi:rubrerythrin